MDLKSSQTDLKYTSFCDEIKMKKTDNIKVDVPLLLCHFSCMKKHLATRCGGTCPYPSTQEAEAGASPRVQGQPRLHSEDHPELYRETLSQKNKKHQLVYPWVLLPLDIRLQALQGLV